VAEYRLIQTDRELARLLERLRQENPQAVAVDLESEHNLHSYGIHVALIQLCDGRQAQLIDTLAVRDRGLLRALLEESPWVKVMFDASGDLATLGTALQMSIRPVFDLSIAARLLGRPGSLARLLDPEGSGGGQTAGSKTAGSQTAGSKSAGSKSGGKAKFQKANWLKRPLPPEQLEYAAGDVLPLLGLADRLLAEMVERGLLYRFLSANARVQEKTRARDPYQGYRRLPEFRRFSAEQKRALALLWHAREKYAEAHDLPPHNVAAHEVLAGIARAAPEDPRGMAEALGQRRSRVSIDVEELAGLIRRAAEQLGAADGAGPEGEE
jgi:ribonuclease D